MKCRKAQQYLTAYVDGELRGWWRRPAFVKHLEKCVPCQKMVEVQKQIKSLIRSNRQRIKAPDKLKNEIWKKIEES